METPNPIFAVQYDFLSGMPMDWLNEQILSGYRNSGFKNMDRVSKLLIPAVFKALNNCFGTLKEIPRYRSMELVWSGGTKEDVDFPLLEKQESGEFVWIVELELLLVLKDIMLTLDVSEPSIIMEGEGRNLGCCIVTSNKIDPLQIWGDCCINTNSARSSNHQHYLSPHKVLDDLFRKIKTTFHQIPLLSELFQLQYNPPTIMLTMTPEFETEVKVPTVRVRCKIMAALELPDDVVSPACKANLKDDENLESQNKDNKSKQSNHEKRLYLVSHPSSVAELRIEWRISFFEVEKSLFAKIKAKTPVAIACYRIFRLICSYHLFSPSCLNLLHLNAIFFSSYRKLPRSVWTKDNVAKNVLGLIDELLVSLATGSLSCYFVTSYNLLSDVHQDFLHTLICKTQKIRQNPTEAIISCTESWKVNH